MWQAYTHYARCKDRPNKQYRLQCVLFTSVFLHHFFYRRTSMNVLSMNIVVSFLVWIDKVFACILSGCAWWLFVIHMLVVNINTSYMNQCSAIRCPVEQACVIDNLLPVSCSAWHQCSGGWQWLVGDYTSISHYLLLYGVVSPLRLNYACPKICKLLMMYY